MIRIMLADDHKILTESMKLLLEKTAEVLVANISHTAEDAIKAYSDVKPDVVLMDIHFFDEKNRTSLMNGIECTNRLKALNPEVKVLILTSEVSSDFLSQIIAVADGYVVKDASIDELINAIKCCHNGMKIFDSTALSRVLTPQREKLKDELEEKIKRLTEKEIAIVNFLAKGLTCKEIAEKYDSTEGYIRNILMNLYDKLDIESRKSTALVGFAARNGILTN